MSINFPNSLDNFTNPVGTDLLENSNAALDHDLQHSNANDAIEALQAKVGVDSSAVTTSHDYKLSEVTSSDKAVGKTATQTLTNKTLTSPKVNVGSDATADMWYRGADGTLTRIPIGSNTQILTSNGSTPSWQNNPSGSDASTTVKGVVEIATTAEITAGTSTGGTGAILVVPASAVGSAGASKLVQFDGSGKYPAADGSAITNIPYPVSNATAGTGVITSSTSEGANPSGTYSMVKEIVCGKNGTFTIRFSLKAQATYTAYGKIYKNGVAVGTERSTTSTSYVTYDENIAFSVGDLIQLYTKSSTGGANIYANGFYIMENAWQINA